MSEENQNQNGNLPQQPAEKQTNIDRDSKQPESTLPKPEPSFGIIDEGRIWSPLKRMQKATNP